jgi:RNA polymerase sigma-70 factor (ECF subfamily)
LEASEEDLVRSAAGGDDGAFHALVDRHAAAMFRVATGLTRNRADAEDLVQETLVGAYRGLKHFAGRSSVKTWLLQILTRQAAKAWHRNRHARRTLSLSGGGSDDKDAGAGAATIAESAAVSRAGGGGVGESGPAAAVEKRLDVMDVLRKLSPPHREILVLREMRQLSYEEIAEVLGVPRGTVESRLSRARAEFRQRYEGPPAPRAASSSADGAGGSGAQRDGGRAG